MVTVLVAARDAATREAVAAALYARRHEAVMAADLESARRSLHSLRAEALVLSTDLGLRGVRELALLVAGQEPAVPVLFLATLDERWTAGALPRRPGLDEVLVRPCAGHEVAQAVARLLQRAEGDFVQIGPAHLHRPSRELRGGGRRGRPHCHRGPSAGVPGPSARPGGARDRVAGAGMGLPGW